MAQISRLHTFFGSVIYPGAFRFFQEFIGNINAQSAGNFGILLLNDGVAKEKLKNQIVAVKSRCEIIPCAGTWTPPQLRVYLMEEAKARGADILVVGDADDLFSADRVACVEKAFMEEPAADFVYNDLYLFDKNCPIFHLPDEVDDIHMIKDYNFLGMSNTAIRISALSQRFIHSLYECDSPAFDWYLHARLLLAGHKGVKAKGAYTRYRIHENNYAGIPAGNRGSTENVAYRQAVQKEIEVKKKQYRLLKQYDPLFEQLYRSYEQGWVMDTPGPCRGWWGMMRAASMLSEGL